MAAHDHDALGAELPRRQHAEETDRTVPDDELAALDRPHVFADLLDNAHVLVSHRGGPLEVFDSAIRPQVRPADARRRQPDDCVGRLDKPRLAALREPNVAGRIDHGTAHACAQLTAWRICHVRQTSFSVVRVFPTASRRTKRPLRRVPERNASPESLTRSMIAWFSSSLPSRRKQTTEKAGG